ncbi:hypothetical protein P43SY_005041 [Pythium insidiosum]|uniref:Fibronectin type-III domain-containing protein n=1 Tax=Pythium insidiosum TaxID=114742 RepID=A0AAD5M5R4_PYTIN|nr:hypothetical protein P43SY_005041 [Pythium insidiosum]KAJ0410721.1 hypothetical protein ATCC90586_006824 [Pythium insidiosum]
MGRATRRKRRDEQQRLYFTIQGDSRNEEERAKARAMLDALQQKLVDDALREDGRLEYTIQDLWPGEVYQFVVAAENRCGLGEFSPFSDYIKMKSTAPDAPERPTIPRIDKRDYSINGGSFEHEIVVFHGREMILEHLKPKTTYQFQVSTANSVGRAPFSPPCIAFTTPSLVGFTIDTYFANRPPIEHASARFIQRWYRSWKRRIRERAIFLRSLSLAIAGWHIL